MVHPLFGKGGESYSHVGAVNINVPTGTQALSWPAGTIAGDYAVVFSAAATNISITGWTRDAYDWTTYGYTSVALRKKLTAAEVSSPPSATLTNGTAIVISVYRGINASVVRGGVTGSGASILFSGFVKGPSKALVMMSSDRDPDGSISAPPSSAWTRRNQASDSLWHSELWDVSASLYRDGDPIAFTLVPGSNNFNQAGILLELT